MYGGKLTDIKRRQRRLAGHAEVMREELASVMAPEDITSAGEDEESFDVDRFRRESSQQPMFSFSPTPLTSYPLFNSAPYSRGASGDKINQQLRSATSSPMPPLQTYPKASAKTPISRGSKLLVEDTGRKIQYTN